MTKLTQKERRQQKKPIGEEYIQNNKREIQNIIDDDNFNPAEKAIKIEFHKYMISQIIETQQIEEEIMTLYNNKFGLDPLDKSERYFTEEEQIERHAQNIVFWRKLRKEYDDVSIFEQPKSPRFRYIIQKEGEISMGFYKKFLNIEGVNDRIGDRVKELMEM